MLKSFKAYELQMVLRFVNSYVTTRVRGKAVKQSMSYRNPTLKMTHNLSDVEISKVMQGTDTTGCQIDESPKTCS